MARERIAQSKWVAERLVWSAMDRGIPATILRPAGSSGTVGPRSESGRCLHAGAAGLHPNRGRAGA